MNDKLKAITSTICAACYNAGCVMHDCSDCRAPAEAIYTAHIKPLEDTLVKTAEREKVLVEALERLARLGMGDRYGNSVGNCIAQDALASVKGEV